MKPGNEALDNSLSSFASLSSSAEPKGSPKGDKNNSLSRIEDEDRSSLSDDSEEVVPLRPLSPSQFVGSLMKRSGSKEKLLAQAATAPPENLSSTSLSHSPTLPLQQDTETDTKEGDTDGRIDLWVRSAMRLGRPFTDEAGKPTGSLKAPARSSSSSSSSSVSKQATARQVAAELIRPGDLSLSAPLISASGTMDNLLPSQVGSDSAGKEQRLQMFTEVQRARLQKSRAERIEPPKTIESSASVEHASASEHALSNARKLKECIETQGERDGERIRKEGGRRRKQQASEKQAIQEENAKSLIKEPPSTRGCAKEHQSRIARRSAFFIHCREKGDGHALLCKIFG